MRRMQEDRALLGGEHISRPLAGALARVVAQGGSFESGWLPLHTPQAAKDVLRSRLTRALKRGRLREASAWAEALRQLVRYQRNQRRALRAAQLQLQPRR